ncbi:uncharacterized protein LOC110464203 [Mizuhopecten yessoensis]|uniref:Uncharacterized protein n=1 Tax=Mizuhopecten yessoensis TaxID=6573 RepID=A0A210PUG5_MIZYE|nr:uncharacterized protein LOC110464203 [Mizuhopecten yessoensis]OWF40128.1 hypothetical protein KP79_PYT05906 [Mizuhopecten yessoensis]
MTSILLCFTTSLLLYGSFMHRLTRSKYQENQHLTSTMEAELLERSCYVKLKQIAPDPQTGYNYKCAIVNPAPATRDDLMNPAWLRYLPHSPKYLERLCYIKLKQIAPNPQSDFSHRAIVHPPPATRDELMTPAWSRYLPHIPKPKSPHGWVSCPPHEEDAELREKSATRNKVWYDLFYKKDSSKTENESFCFNVMKKHRTTKSLHDILLTRNPSDDVIGSPASGSCSV